jgi:hypothetical protein
MKKRLINEFYIRTKDGKKKKFVHNPAQLDYESKRTGKDYILKARQIGFTTYEQLRKLERALVNKYINVATVAHRKDKTEDIFQIAKFAWDNLPDDFKRIYGVKYDNVRELAFGKNGSRYFVDMDIRSGTVKDLHISEFAFNSDIDKLFSSTFESVPKDGDITLETTANGLNEAHDFWVDTVNGKTGYKAHFYNWTWLPEYSMNPPENGNWKGDYLDLAKKYSLISDIQERFSLSDEQFYWYYLKAVVLKERTKQEYPTVPEEAFLSSSISVFDLFKVTQLIPRNVLETHRGVHIFIKPIEGHKYCIGVDTAEGVGGDYTAVEVWDMTDDVKVQVASMSDDMIRPDQVAGLVLDLAQMYNRAFIIPERNSSGLSTVLKLQENGYQNLYVDRSIDTITQAVKNEYGWRTSASNRDVMIDDFVELFESGKLDISSPELIRQMKTFIRKKNGRREHEEGYHDDNLFGSFLAIQGAKYHREVRVVEGIAF